MDIVVKLNPQDVSNAHPSQFHRFLNPLTLKKRPEPQSIELLKPNHDASTLKLGIDKHCLN